MDLIVRHQGREEKVQVERADGGWRVRVGEAEYAVDVASLGGGVRSLIVDGGQYEVAVFPESRHRYLVSTARGSETVEIMDPLTHLAASSHGAGRGGVQNVTAYMPGRVVKVLVAEGETVAAGQGLVVLEAMKMENEIQAEAPGVVKKVLVQAGQAVDGGDVLFEIEPAV
jgi:pyruvate carboxylase subunit B